MDSVLAAAIWFWIPLLTVPLGAWISISGNAKIPGRILAIAGLVLVMASPWTVPESDSSAGGHLLLSILGPSLLMAYGLHGMIFGGYVPVGRLDSSARWSGFVAVATAIAIFCLMHWSSWTPVWRGDVNPFWLAFWPTFLMFSTSLCAMAALALVGFGEDRFKEALQLTTISVIMAGIALFAIIFDGSSTSADEFRGHLWLAAADILGTVIGIVVAIAAFAIVIWGYESSLPEPENAAPPTEKEIAHAIEIASRHIGGEEE